MTEELLCKNLLVGVSGSIHALDIHNYLYQFRTSLAQTIKVIMTAHATNIVNPKTVELYADDKVFIDIWDHSTSVTKAAHIQLTRWADLFVVVPATANIIGKAANGIADDLLSSAILSYPRTVVFAPIMNQATWQSKALQRNIKRLQEDGHYIVPPDSLNVVVSTGDWDQGMGSSPESVLLHLKHVRMKELREGYWEEAVSEKPLSPMQRKLKKQEEMGRTPVATEGASDQH